MKRISRGTPHVLTTGEIESIFAALSKDPLLEGAVAQAFDMTVESWRHQTKAKRVAQFLDLQERGRLAAVGAQSLKARRDFMAEAYMVANNEDPSSVADRLRLVETQLAELTAYIRGTAASKGA